MNKIKCYPALGLIILCGSLLCSCEEEETHNYNEVYAQVDACINQNRLLLKVEQETDNTCLFFDGDTVFIPTKSIASINTDAIAWRTTLTDVDGTTIIIPTLGNLSFLKCGFDGTIRFMGVSAARKAALSCIRGQFAKTRFDRRQF